MPRELVSILRVRNVRLYLVGVALSLFGSSAMRLVAGLWVKTLTGSSGLAALAVFCGYAATLAAPVLGVLVDRVSRRSLLLATNIAMVVALMPLLFVNGRGDVWMIFTVMVIYGLAQVVVSPAETALLTALLPPEQLGEINSTQMMLQEGMKIIAPLAGAGLFAVAGGRFVVILDAVTFAAAACTFLLMQVSESTPKTARPNWVNDTVAGLRYIAHTRQLRQLAFSAALVLLAFGFMEGVAYAIIDDGLNLPPEFRGVMASLQGAGSIVGGLLAPMVMRRHGEGRLIGTGMVIFAAGASMLTLPWVGAVLVGAALNGLGVPWLIVGVITYIQRTTHPELLGRVSATITTVLFSPITLAIAIGGGLVTVVDYRILLAAMAATGLVTGVYVLTRPEQRNRTPHNHPLPRPAAD